MAEAILAYIRKNKLDPFPPDSRGYYHNVVSLIISQRIRFTKSQAIRAAIYTILGTSNLDTIMSLTPAQRAACGLTDDKWRVITEFTEHGESAKGIGPWTIACARIMVGDFSVGFIATDSSVNALTRSITGGNAPLVFASAHEGGRAFSALWNSVRFRNAPRC